jgi:Acetyltransferase (GNAT) domain
MLQPSLKVLPRSSAEENFTLRYLEPSEYYLWDELVDVSPQGSVFCRSWWLSAVGDVRVLACFSGKQIVAGMPLYFERHYGIRVCTMPKLTRAWGVIMRPLEGKQVAAASRETKILQAFAVKLARCKLFFQAFHSALLNWLPFYWSGFRQTTHFTHVLDDLSDLNRVWHGMSESARGQVRKAEKAGLTVVPCSIDEVYRCERQSFLRQGREPSHRESLLRSVHDSARANGSAACFAIADREGTVYSARLLVWDRNRTYNLVAGADSALRGSAANSLGVWSAIQFAAQRSRAFDFAGSVMEGIARFNRNFGAKQVPYNLVIKAPILVNCYLQFTGKL